MTWDRNRPIKADWYGGEIRPDEVLFEIDGPTIFTARLGLSKFLFFKHDETDDAEIFVAAPVSDSDLEALRAGRISVRGALSYRDAWLIKTDFDYVVERYQEHDFSSIEPYLPPKGVGIASSFGIVPDSIEQANSLLSFKFIGQSLTEQAMPLSVFKDLVDNISTFVRKTLLPTALSQGRYNRFFDVTIGQPKFASLLVSIKGIDIDSNGLREFKPTKFLNPDDLRQESIERSDELWKSIAETSKLAQEGDLTSGLFRQNRAFLDQIGKLVPSSDNDLECLEISYHGFTRTQVVTIDQASGDRIIQAGQLDALEPETIIGVVIEVNGAAKTFIVKDELNRQTTVAPKWRVFAELEKNSILRIGAVMRLTGLISKRKRRDYMTTEDYPEIVDARTRDFL